MRKKFFPLAAVFLLLTGGCTTAQAVQEHTLPAAAYITDASPARETSAKSENPQTQEIAPSATTSASSAPASEATPEQNSAALTEPERKAPTESEIPQTQKIAPSVITSASSAPAAEAIPERGTAITLLGPNMVYAGESFTYHFEISSKTKKEPKISWQCDGNGGEIADDGLFTAKSKGIVMLSVNDSANGLFDTLIVHVVETAADVDFVPEVNGIPIVNKTYPLPANYNPGDLTEETYNAFMDLVSGAAADNIEITFISGFRSYGYQEQVHNNWIEKYGEETADRLSARAGHSEHQLGLAIDVNSLLTEFAETPEGVWLAENCWKYGFIIRYSKDAEPVTGYMYEPWHIRYLGKELAEKVTKSGLCLEDYLGINSYYR